MIRIYHLLPVLIKSKDGAILGSGLNGQKQGAIYLASLRGYLICLLGLTLIRYVYQK